MKRTYTLFIATEELLKNHTIQLFSKLHSFHLTLRQPQTVSVIIPVDTASFDLDRACVVYEPELVDLQHATIQCDRGTLYLTLTLEARELGSTHLSVIVPDSPTPNLPQRVTSRTLVSSEAYALEAEEGTYKER
jgi:hypothetical protein